jgi:hypothetical protein
MPITQTPERVLGLDTDRLRKSVAAGRDLEYLVGRSVLPARAELMVNNLEMYGPLITALVTELNGGQQVNRQQVNSLLPVEALRERAPKNLKPLLANDSDLPGKLVLNTVRTLMEDETGQAWIGARLDQAEPYVSVVDFNSPRHQAVEEIARFMDGVQAVARHEAAKSRGLPIDPNKPDKGVKPVHVAIGLQTILQSVINGDPQITSQLPMIARTVDSFPNDPQTGKKKFKLPALFKLQAGAHTIIGALNDVLPEEYKNPRLQRAAWQFNFLAKTALFFSTSETDPLGKARKMGARMLGHAIMALPDSGEETVGPFRTLRKRFPTVELEP